MQEDKLGLKNIMPQCTKLVRLLLTYYTWVMLSQWLNGKTSKKLLWFRIFILSKNFILLFLKMLNNFKLHSKLNAKRCLLKDQNKILGTKEHEIEMEIHQI